MNLLTKLRYVPKRFGVLGALFVAAAVPAVLLAWGPDRPTYTVEQPADHVTFNSITNNPNYGDERNFVTIKDAANTSEGGWQDELNVTPGKEYLVRMYVHNNAAQNLNLSATNTRVKANVPTTTGKSVQIDGFVSADNAAPKEVWDQAILKSTSDFNVAYVAGSATMYNNVFTSGTKLTDGIVTSAGTPVGYDKIDGKVPGCFQYSGVVTFKVKVQGPSTATFDMNKTVRKTGATEWVESAAVKPGDTVQYRIKYTNTGKVQQDDVTVRDTLPSGVSYVAGSTKLHTVTKPEGVTLTDDVTKGGVNIGSYQPGSTAYVIFSAKVAGNDQLPTCGPNTLKNVANVETDYGNKSDDANVTVPKECQPPEEEAKFACTALTVGNISDTQFSFDAARTVENAEYVHTVFIVRDAQGKEIARVNDADGKYNYTQATVGKYTVEAQIVVKIDGQEKVSPVGNCKKPFEVKKEETKPEYACTSLKKIEKSRDTYEFTTAATATGGATIKEVKVDFGDGKNQTVDYGTTVSHQYQPGTWNAVAYVTFTVDGKNVPNQTSDACKVQVKVEEPPKADECKPGIPVGDAKCEEKPEECVPSDDKACEETPAELPSTGPAAILGGLFGSSAVSYGVYSYVASRRALRDSMNR